MNPPDVLTLMRDANPHPESDELTTDAWSYAVLLADIDTRRQHMSMDLETRNLEPTPPPRRDLRWVAAAMAFGLIVALIGVIAWLARSSESDVADVPVATIAETTTTTTRSQAPALEVEPTTSTSTTTAEADPKALSVEQQTLVDDYFTAWSIDDVDGFLGLFDPGYLDCRNQGGDLTCVSRLDPTFESDVIASTSFFMAFGASYDVTRCEADDATVGCVFWWTDPWVRGNYLRLQGWVELEFGESGLITRRDVDFGQTQSERVEDLVAFADWWWVTDPATAERAILRNGSPVFTVESADLWKEHVPMYFAQGR